MVTTDRPFMWKLKVKANSVCVQNDYLFVSNFSYVI